MHYVHYVHIPTLLGKLCELVSQLVVGVAHSDLSDLMSFKFCRALIFHFVPLTYLTASKYILHNHLQYQT